MHFCSNMPFNTMKHCAKFQNNCTKLKGGTIPMKFYKRFVPIIIQLGIKQKSYPIWMKPSLQIFTFLSEIMKNFSVPEFLKEVGYIKMTPKSTLLHYLKTCRHSFLVHSELWQHSIVRCHFGGKH